MANYAIIINNVVENIIVWDEVSPYEFPEGSEYINIEELPGVGMRYIRTESGWEAPAEDGVQGDQ